MLSIPLFTVQSPYTAIVTNNARMGTLNNIRNLNMSFSFYHLPHRQPCEDLDRWSRTCQILGSMSNLRFLCIYILQYNSDSSFQTQHPEQTEEQVRWLLKPLDSIRNVKDKGGRFDVITAGWTVPFVVDEGQSFNSLQDNLPPHSELAERMRGLGEFWKPTTSSS